MIKCSNCQLIVDDDSNFCKKCGYAIKRANNLLDNQSKDILTEIYKNLDNIKFKYNKCSFNIYADQLNINMILYIKNNQISFFKVIV
jgi:hypothetical protein